MAPLLLKDLSEFWVNNMNAKEDFHVLFVSQNTARTITSKKAFCCTVGSRTISNFQVRITGGNKLLPTGGNFSYIRMNVENV